METVKEKMTDQEIMQFSLELLKEIRVEIGQRYNNAVADADWHNNNMPNVGQTVDYKPYPAKPKELELIDAIIKKIEQ